MTEAEYLALTAACDALLSAADATPERIAISWLHVRSEHPMSLQPYERIFAPPSRFDAARRILKRWAGVIGNLARAAVQRDREDIRARADFPERIDVLFLSHLVSDTADRDAADFYFGHLPEELAARGFSSLLALRNHVGRPHRAIARRWLRGGTTARVVLPRWCSLAHEVAMLRAAVRAAAQLRRIARRESQPLVRAVAREAARHASSRTTLAHLRVHGVVRDLCRRFRPRAVFVTWEGHAWERLAFHAARGVDPRIRCVGYQHTIVLPRSHALKRPLGGGYDPDAVLTVGDITRDMIAAAPAMAGVQVVTYGSHRRPAAPLPRRSDADTRCLVIPEGLEPECLKLFDFAFAAAAVMPEIEFVLRMHPVLPFERLVSRHPHLGAMPDNVRVSVEPDLAVDLAACSWALYRGSSAAVYAVLAGVRPVYVECAGELVIDPLFALEGWRRRVATAEAFRALVAEDIERPTKERQRGREAAAMFSQRYVMHADPEVVDALLRGSEDA